MLAAGKASRYGSDEDNKLLAEFEGVPLVRRTALRASKSNANSVIVVVGFQAADIISVLAGLPINIATNRDFPLGISSSLMAGLTMPEARSADGVLVMLADMPTISTLNLNSVIDAFAADDGRSIVVAAHGGVRGNPVIIPKSLFGDLMFLEGDVGARNIIRHSGIPIVEVEIGAAALHDVDTTEAVIAAGGTVLPFQSRPNMPLFSETFRL